MKHALLPPWLRTELRSSSNAFWGRLLNYIKTFSIPAATIFCDYQRNLSRLIMVNRNGKSLDAARDLRQSDLVKVDCGPRQNVALPPPELPLRAMAASARLDARRQDFAQISVLYWLLSPCCEFPVSSRLIQPNKKGPRSLELQSRRRGTTKTRAAFPSHSHPRASPDRRRSRATGPRRRWSASRPRRRRQKS